MVVTNPVVGDSVLFKTLAQALRVGLAAALFLGTQAHVDDAAPGLVTLILDLGAVHGTGKPKNDITSACLNWNLPLTAGLFHQRLQRRIQRLVKLCPVIRRL